MARRSSGSTVVRGRLGHALRALREGANIRIERAARELECSVAKISRLENGLGPAKVVEVRALLDLYGQADPDRRAQFEKWAAGTKASGWWESDADLISSDAERFNSLETESVHLRSFCTPVLPTILHTPAYSLAHIRGRTPDLPYADAERIVAQRQKRQDALLDPDVDLQLDAVIDEAAIRREVGSAETLAAQLTWLADLLDRLESEGRADVRVWILPFSAGMPGKALSAFALFTPRESEFDPVAALVEDTCSYSWYEADEDVAPLIALFDELKTASLDPHDSRRMLRRT